MEIWTHKPYNNVDELLIDIRRESVCYRFRDNIYENKGDVYKDLRVVMYVSVSMVYIWMMIQHHNIIGERIELTEDILKNRLYVLR